MLKKIVASTVVTLLTSAGIVVGIASPAAAVGLNPCAVKREVQRCIRRIGGSAGRQVCCFWRGQRGAKRIGYDRRRGSSRSARRFNTGARHRPHQRSNN